jgi:hypothetical protein
MKVIKWISSLSTWQKRLMSTWSISAGNCLNRSVGEVFQGQKLTVEGPQGVRPNWISIPRSIQRKRPEQELMISYCFLGK